MRTSSTSQPRPALPFRRSLMRIHPSASLVRQPQATLRATHSSAFVISSKEGGDCALFHMLRKRASPVNRYASGAVFAILLGTAGTLHAQTAAPPPPPQQLFDGPSRTWLRQGRIAAYPLTASNADAIVRQAQASGVYGIEVDNDIPGRYESLLDPKEKLEAIRLVASRAHRVHTKALHSI